MISLTKSAFFVAALAVSTVALADGMTSLPPRVLLADGMTSLPPRLA